MQVGVPLLDVLFGGCDSMLLGYGQTGSGKTFSLLQTGEEDQSGVVWRLGSEIFARSQADSHLGYQASAAACCVLCTR